MSPLNCCGPGAVDADPQRSGTAADAGARRLMPPGFARNTLLGFSSGAFVALTGFIGTAIAARLLGPEGMGVIAYAVWCVTVAGTIAGLGISLVLQRFVPNLRAEGKDDEAEALVGTTARLSILAAILGSVLLIGWLYWPGRSAIDTPGEQTPRIVYIAIVLVWFLCLRMADVYLSYLRGEQRFGEFAWLSALSGAIKLVVLGLGAWMFGVAGALAGYCASYVVAAPLILRLLRKKGRLRKELRREVFNFALASWTAGILGGLVFGRTEIVFLEHYSGIGAVGLFAAAVTITEMTVQLAPLLLSALLPYFSQQDGLGAHDDMHRLYRAMTGVLAMVVIPLCVGMAAIAPVLVPLTFGPEFADAVPATSVLLVAAAVSNLGVVTAYLMYSTGRSGVLLISNAIGLAATIALGFLLIPRFGLMGAACSRGAVQTLVVVFETWYVSRKLGFVPPFRALGAITLVAVAQGAVAYILCRELGGVLSLAIAVPAAILVFLSGLRVLAVIPKVDPALNDRLIEHAPHRIRHLLTNVLTLLSPAKKWPRR